MKSLFKFFFKVFLRTKVKEKYIIKADDLLKMLKVCESLCITYLWDGSYKYPKFETMMKIIKYDMVKWSKYRLEEYDCDNFAVSFAGFVPFIYGVNNVGIAVGRIIDDVGHIGYHAWNIFIARKNDGTPEVYMYEPQTGKFSTYKHGRIGKWKYEPIYVIWG